MPMGIALWYNPKQEDAFAFSFITHDQWLRDPAKATQLGISLDTQKMIAKSLDADLIRMAAIMEGMVRVRDYYDRISVQFHVEEGLKELLAKIHKVLKKQSFAPDSILCIDNLRTGESAKLTLAELGERLAVDAPILVNQRGETGPMDLPNHPLVTKVLEEKLKALQSETSTGS